MTRFVEFIDSDGDKAAVRLDAINALVVARGLVSLVSSTGQRITLRGSYEENMRLILAAANPTDAPQDGDRPLVGCCGPTGPNPCGKADCVLCTPFGGG